MCPLMGTTRGLCSPTSFSFERIGRNHYGGKIEQVLNNDLIAKMCAQNGVDKDTFTTIGHLKVCPIAEGAKKMGYCRSTAPHFYLLKRS